MTQSTTLIMYDNKVENAVLSGGSWQTTLPLSNIVNKNIRKVARSTDSATASTQFTVSFADPIAMNALAAGPTNLTVSYAYRISWYNDAAFTSQIGTTGWVNPFEASIVDFFDIPWEASYFWTGVQEYDDIDRGIWLIHAFTSQTTARYWKIEINDTFNTSGYIQIGYLFMANSWSPSINYAPESNGLTFLDGSLVSTTLAGGKAFWRRINRRSWTCKFPSLPTSEVYASAYTVIQKSGYDKYVFVIPDPSDVTNIQKRAFMGTIAGMDPLSQAATDRSSFGFTVEEVV